tara:strand:+ start:4404 stop:5822 length:1419 start_codon:yes stop_codon:yes gene_type:complete
MEMLQPSLEYFAEKLSSFTTNTFKLQPAGKTDSIGPNDIIQISLPSNSLIDMDSFQLHMNVGVTGTVGRLSNIEHLFSQVDVFVGGVQMTASNPYYNVLCALKDAVSWSHSNPVTGHSEIIRSQPPYSAAALSGNEALIGTALNSGLPLMTVADSPYCVDSWQGMIGTIQPRILDTALLGPVSVRITMAANSVLTDSANALVPTLGLFDNNTTGDAKFTSQFAGAAVYTCRNLFATIDCCSFTGSAYDSIVEQRLNSGNGLELPFKNIFSQSQAHSGVSSMSVSTQSLDRVWVGFRPTSTISSTSTSIPKYKDYNVQNSPLLVPGYQENRVETVHATGLEKYVAPAFTFCALGQSNSIFLSINNTNVPQYPLPFAEVPAYTCSNLQDGEYFPEKLTMLEFATVRNVFCTRLNVPHAEGNRQISGLDTRNSNVLMKINTQGSLFTGHTVDSMCFMECTSSMMVSPGRQCVVVQ